MPLAATIAGFGLRFEQYASRSSPWTNTYGLARSLIALATFLTLLINPSGILFRPAVGDAHSVGCLAMAKSVSLFCLASNHLELARFVACLLLVPTVIGYRPRFAGLLHWWVSYSTFASATIVDGGDQVAATLTLLVLPLTLTDRRTWHWQADRESAHISTLAIGFCTIWALQAQVAFIYLAACIEKLKVPEWADGTNMFYILSNNYLGAPSYLKPVLQPLITSPLIALVTWSVLALEFMLGVNPLLPKAFRVTLVQAGILFHVLIALTMGITSFSIVMSGALLLGVSPTGLRLSEIFGRYKALLGITQSGRRDPRIAALP